MTASEQESISLSVNIFEELDTIVTKNASYNTHTADNFTVDTEQKCSDNNSSLVTSLLEHINIQISRNDNSGINSISLNNY